MLAAEKWYKYQESYKKYGLDMKPARRVVKTEEPVTSRSKISAKDKARLLILVLFAGFLSICLIVIAAYSTQIKFNTNSILAQANVVQGEIENLNVAIKSANNIAAIEARAETELGMVYPTIDQTEYIETDINTIPDFALALKQMAFKID